MTNHSEASGTSGNSDISGQNGCERGGEPSAYPGHGTAAKSSGEQQVTLRTPAELADALPYLLGYRPEDSIVLVALHDRDARGRFGGRARLGIPAQTDDWPSVAQQLAHGLVTGSERRGAKPESMVAFLCQDPTSGEAPRDVMERLRPLAQLLRRACGSLDVPVVEALCISDGRFWSYCCPGNGCCAAEGEPMGLPGTSVLAAAATYAGLQIRGTLKEMRARLLPWETAAALQQEAALDSAQSALIPRILDAHSRAEVAEETLAVAQRIIGSLADTPTLSGMLDADLRDDELIGHVDAATLILGLQDRATRDRAAEWMEGDEATRRSVSGVPSPAAVSAPTASMRPHRSRSWAGSHGPPVTNWRLAKPWPWPSPQTLTTSSPASSTRPATRASTPSPFAAACARSAGARPGGGH